MKNLSLLTIFPSFSVSGFVEINKASSMSLLCEVGKEIRLANNGKKGAVLFVIDDTMCVKTVKLSKYL